MLNWRREASLVKSAWVPLNGGALRRNLQWKFNSPRRTRSPWWSGVSMNRQRKPAIAFPLRCLMVPLVFLAGAGAVWSDLIITNAAGVRAGITGIISRPANNSIGVDFSIVDP